MIRLYGIALASAMAILCACSGGNKQEPAASKDAKPAPAEPPRITQLYATVPTVAPGGKSLLCYGTENANAAWLSPPRQELSAALSRCIEVAPARTTTYTLTAEGAGGQSVTRDVTVAVGAAPPSRARIVEVTVTSLSVRAGEPVSLCYNVQNAVSVGIAPIGYLGGGDKGCAIDHPAKTTTYSVTARGAENEDTERVTVKVR